MSFSMASRVAANASRKPVPTAVVTRERVARALYCR
jgi:hypothetical protein